jgi:hypothetical protein
MTATEQLAQTKEALAFKCAELAVKGTAYQATSRFAEDLAHGMKAMSVRALRNLMFALEMKDGR